VFMTHKKKKRNDWKRFQGLNAIKVRARSNLAESFELDAFDATHALD
jgi:hypothetical protein